MFKIFKSQYKGFDFMKIHKIFFGVSLLFIFISIGSFFVRGLNFGIDFTGGLLFDITIPENKDIAEVREVFSSHGFDNFTIQSYGDDGFLIKLSEKEASKSLSQEISQSESINYVKSIVNSSFDGEVKYNKIDFVGPQVGKELIIKGALALLLALLVILVYIWVRFEKEFGIGAVITLIHDVIIIFAVYSFFGIEFDLTSIAAILTIIGYSINDTVVIYDRIREFLVKYKKEDFSEIINRSLQTTLRRTVLTSSTTLVCLAILAFMGGDTIRNFSIIVIVGILIGTYSSIFISAPLLLYISKDKKK